MNIENVFYWILFIIGCFGVLIYANNLNENWSGLLLLISISCLGHGILGRDKYG